MRLEVETPAALGVERRRLSNSVAERIATTADRLERQAAQVRASDKQLALLLTKEAVRLRRVARTLDIQHKRGERARLRRRNMFDEDARLIRQEVCGAAFSGVATTGRVRGGWQSDGA